MYAEVKNAHMCFVLAYRDENLGGG